MLRPQVPALVCAIGLLGSACRGTREPDLGRLYDRPAQLIGEARTPVVVLPGLLGSKLEDGDSGDLVWGSFTLGCVDVDRPAGARQLGLPMVQGVPLRELTDSTVPTEVLDVLVADVGIFRGLELSAYVDILRTLAVGRYRDQSLGNSGAIDYGGLHYTCFQYAYDWRRDIAESAAALDRMIHDAQAAVRAGRAGGQAAAGLAPEGLHPVVPIKVDVIAHSMGGLVLRYYLRYGTQPLPADGSLPELTWAGAGPIRKAILIGTPSAGSVRALYQIVEGMNLHPLFPNYRPALLGTMPAIYQLLPRVRHRVVVDAESGEPVDFFDPEVWVRNGWGLMDPDEATYLEWLIPDVADAEARRQVALDHLRKSLALAEQFQRALDLPASPPPGTELILFAGDADDTDAMLEVQADGGLEVVGREPGDGTVTRQSALMDERLGQEWSSGLDSPVDWSRVQFLSSDHLGMTKDPVFIDNLLYLLLEDPR